MEKIGYARVSTRGQSIQSQREKLKAEGCTHIFEDAAVSGTRASHQRPGLKDLLAHVESLEDAKVEDTEVLVCHVDRLGRDAMDTMATVRRLLACGASFRTLDGRMPPLRPGEPIGQAVFGVFAVMAELERAYIAERMETGLAEAHLAGTPHGRPPVLDRANLDTLRAEQERGVSIRSLAKRYRISRGTVIAALREDYVPLEAWQERVEASRLKRGFTATGARKSSALHR